ncbi:MAG: hypothetical protein E7598_01385 [Ruminococcaceae bacterium]|nr:hypothetical protein [Oscillospiraceae bacterium]
MPRKFPISGLIFAAIALLIGLLGIFVHEYVGGILYVFIYLFCGIEFSENIDVYYSDFMPIAFVALYTLASVLSLLFWIFASERVYTATKAVRNVLATLIIAPWALFVLFVPLTVIYMYTDHWCRYHSDMQLFALLFLVPVLFVFFSELKFKINPIVGDVTVALTLSSFMVHSYIIVKYFLIREYNTYDDFINAVLIHEYLPVFCAVSFVILWVFEQMLRGDDGKLKPLSRVLMTALAALSAVTVIVVSIAKFNAFKWLLPSILILSIPIFAMFVAYIVKVNKKINRFKEIS